MSTLYLVSTPIGNLKDITLRALDVLGEVDLILAEDTRKTQKLLSAHHITKPIESLHEHNEEARIPSVLNKLRSGKQIALVSDAGTPTLSDPGFKLVRAALNKDIKVVPIPGASSLLAALVPSGLPTDRILFVGYLPKKPGKKCASLDFIEFVINKKPTTVVFFESPYRINKTLQTLAERFPEKELVIARELTKIHEEFYRGKVKDLAASVIKQKGEFTLLLR